MDVRPVVSVTAPRRQAFYHRSQASLYNKGPRNTCHARPGKYYISVVRTVPHQEITRVILCRLIYIIMSSDSVLSSKTAIFPKKEGRKREISNESARGSSLREANV